MSAPKEELLGELRRQFELARDEGRYVAFEALREETGYGHSDLQAGLDHLHGLGEVREEAPGEWVTVPEAGVEPSAGEVVAAREREAAAARAMARRDEHEDGAEPEPERGVLLEGAEKTSVVLTMRVAESLAPEVLGGLVAAGIAEAKDAGRPFELIVR